MDYKILSPDDTLSLSAAQKIVDKINHAVRMGEVKNNHWGASEERGYWFVAPGSLTSSERLALYNQIRDAGWWVVTVRNSEDKGEQPGLAVAIIRYSETEFD